MQNIAKRNYPGSVAFYDTRPGNEVGLFYSAPESTRGSFQHAVGTTRYSSTVCDDLSAKTDELQAVHK